MYIYICNFILAYYDINAYTVCHRTHLQSAGTDDVFLCTDLEEAEVAFNRIFGKRNGLGLINESVLVQEFLSGVEYVVDQVSKDGVHKLIAIWVSIETWMLYVCLCDLCCTCM